MNINEQHIPYFDFLVAPLSGEQAKDILEKVDEGVINYLKFMDGNQSPLIVDKGTTLFTFNPPLEGMEESEQASADNLLTHTIEDTDSLTKEDNNYIANNDGILLIHENLIKFIPVKYDGYCTIEISEDKTAVIANIYPASGDGKQLSVDDVVKVIKKKNISVSLDQLEIKRALNKVNKEGESISKIIIAKAKPPMPGKEAWVEYLFETEPKAGAVVDEHGNTDFHSRNLFESVTKDQAIAIYHPMINGEDGLDVFGEAIVPPKIKNVKPPTGNKIYYSEKKPTHILSKIDGYISLVRGKIVITNMYNVNGDIDFNTGHVVSKGSIVVTGNVISGFNIDMSETIKVIGYVNDSNLNAGGDVTINGGFSGTGKGAIISRGNVSVRYIRNQTIHSRGDISIEKEVVEATIYAYGDIKSPTDNMIIMGGHTIAGGDVKVNTLGHEYGMKTIVEAGYDYHFLSQIKKIEIVASELKKELVTLKLKFEPNIGNSNASLRKQQEAKVNLIKYQEINKNYEALINTKDDLLNRIESSSGSKIIVSGKIYPGVKIVIDAHHLEVKEVMNSKVFMVSKEEEAIIVTSI